MNVFLLGMVLVLGVITFPMTVMAEAEPEAKPHAYYRDYFYDDLYYNI